MAREARCPFAPPPEVLELGSHQTGCPRADLGRQHAVAHHRLRGGAGTVRRLTRQRRRPPSRASRTGTRACWPQCTSARGRCSRPTARSTPAFAGCCQSRSRTSGSRDLRPAIQKITDEHIDAILAGPQPADIVTGLALPVPSLVISEILGVPYEDAEFFQHHANVGLARYATAEDNAKGAMGLAKYLAQSRRGQDGKPRRGCGVRPGRACQGR